MRIGVLSILAVGLLTTAKASVITVTITGTTSRVQVGEGPIFGYSSYQKISDGTAFRLVYTFDDTKGKGGVSEVDGGIITQSGIENTDSSSPGVNAILQIGRAIWEFGPSTDSQVKLNTSSNTKSEQILFSIQQAAIASLAAFGPPNIATGHGMAIGGRTSPPTRLPAVAARFQPITAAFRRKGALSRQLSR